MTETNGGKQVGLIAQWLEKYWPIFLTIITITVFLVNNNRTISENKDDIIDIKTALQNHIDKQVDAEKQTAAALSRIEQALDIKTTR